MRGLDDERVRLREIQTISAASGSPLCLSTWVRVEGNHAPCVRSGGRRFRALRHTAVPTEITGGFSRKQVMCNSGFSVPERGVSEALSQSPW